MTSLAVVGPGSVGTYFAAHLAAAGHDVLACVRRPFDEYVVESPEAPVRVAARTVQDPGAVEGPVPWVLFTVKGHQSVGAAPWLERLCGPGTVVVVVQNGVEGEQRVTPLAGPATVLPAVVYCGAELLEPGHIRHNSANLLIVPDRPRADELAALFEGTGGRVKVTDDFVTEQWRKLGANVAANGITALTLRRNDVLGDPAVGELAAALVSECFTVARAEGAALSDEDARTMAGGFRGASGGTSMYYDRRDGKPLEHDAIYGAVQRAGRRHGIPTPLHDAFAALLGACSRPD